MKVEVDRIVGSYWLCNTISRSFPLFHKGSKHPVPDDKCRPIILIQIMDVTCMMYPMMGGCHHNIFNWSGQFFNILGMDPKLIEDSRLMADKKDKRIKADQDSRDEKNEFDVLGPS